MMKLIDEKLDQFFKPTSSRYGDNSIWKEVFDIAMEQEAINPDLYNYEIKRLRDLKNTIDYAKAEGRRQGIIEGKREAKIELAKEYKESGISTAIIIKATGLSEEDINKL